jgi:hypothetical protein
MLVEATLARKFHLGLLSLRRKKRRVKLARKSCLKWNLHLRKSQTRCHDWRWEAGNKPILRLVCSIYRKWRRNQCQKSRVQPYLILTRLTSTTGISSTSPTNSQERTRRSFHTWKSVSASVLWTIRTLFPIPKTFLVRMQTTSSKWPAPTPKTALVPYAVWAAMQIAA